MLLLGCLLLAVSLAPAVVFGQQAMRETEASVVTFVDGKLLDPSNLPPGWSTTKVLAPTRTWEDQLTDEKLFEYDTGQLYYIDVKSIRESVHQKLSTLNLSGENTGTLLGTLTNASFVAGPYRVDLSFTLLGQFALYPTEGRTGCEILTRDDAENSTCLQELLAVIAPSRDNVRVIIRGCEPAPVGVLLRALKLRKAHVSMSYVDEDEPLKFSTGRSK